mmetsp:Transcript_15525/g.17775  ORF Transcript_15525/g.17775 Transcript_15525/m.17775 type:complete len:85 (-) Transcript_15525:11-265(-)
MCHELAHCIHRHHEKSFFKLMREIQQEHTQLVRSMVSSNRTRNGKKNGSINNSSSIKKARQNRKKGKGRRLGSAIKKRTFFHPF